MHGLRPAPEKGAEIRQEADTLQDADTQMTAGGVPAEGDQDSLVPGLTVLGHPDWSRVGDRVPLPELAAGHSVQLSRLQPLFRNPTTGDARALGVTHLSRQPIRVARRDGSGTIEIGVQGTRTSVTAGGEKIRERRVFEAQEVERGVILELGHRVVLLLHTLPCSPVVSRADDELVGESQALQSVREDIERLASLDVPVLLRGATGTGKELVARALHQRGARRAKPFVAVSMATLPATLAAAELFGAVKGAYTGADRRKSGFFQKADGGTLFLDEIGEASGELQAMLLRVLETGEVTPVGSVDARAVDVRVIAATDADLERAMTEERFRLPLFHRLAGFTIHVPPLTNRRDDVGRLLVHFLRREMNALGTFIDVHAGRPWPPSSLVARLAQHNWPGNVRELRNVARWLAVKGPAGVARAQAELDRLLGDRETSPNGQRPGDRFELPSAPVADPPASVKLYRSPRDVTDDELLKALRAHRWRLKPTAKHLRVSRTSLYALIDRCPRIRRAADLLPDDLAAAFERHGGDLVAMADDLEVSPEGLRHRLQELEIPGS